MPERTFGLGKGDVYPASAAKALLNPLRRFLQPPRRLAELVAAGPHERVLELGCGPGWFSPELAAMSRLHLADLQPPMLRIARERVRTATATAADATALPFRDASFDAAVLAVVFGEIPDGRAALAEITRVLRPSGRLVVLETRTDPDYTSLVRLCAVAESGGLYLAQRRRGVLGYYAVFRASSSF